jgi:prepilin-type N-terminal cleavage/methylation domain-containing protein
MKKGFTMIEVMLSVALLTAIAGIGSPIYQSFQNKNNLDVTTTTVVQTLRRAQVLAQSVEGDMPWGVKLQSGSLVLFKGDVFETRDTAFDEVFDIPAGVTPSGESEILFSKLTGIPQTTGSMVLSITANETTTIYINEKGTITF